jgi:hypothetical protein
VELTVTGVEPQPRVDLLGADPESGARVRVTTYVGTFTVHSGGDSTTRAEGRVGFWVPDAIAHPAAVAAGAVVQAQVVPLGLAPVHEDNDVVVLDAGARLAPDPGDPAWVRVGVDAQLQLRNLVGTTEKIAELMRGMGRDPAEFPVSRARFGYRVTTVVPHGS